MRALLLSPCLLWIACGAPASQAPASPASPAADSTASGATSGESSPDVEVTFEKWVTTKGGAMAGVVSLGDASGTYTGQVTAFTQLEGGASQLAARYDVHLPPRDIDFSADVEGQQDKTGRGVLDGAVTTGSYAGARAHVEYQEKAVAECSAAAG